MTETDGGAAGAERSPWRVRLGALDWRAKARWFGAEYLIVVLGVLTAVGINAWWGEREDRAQERAYLLQLAADLRETERLVEQADVRLFLADASGAKLVEAFYLPERPPRDSLISWFSEAYMGSGMRPLLGTAEALVATGDLALIRDDSLRSAITAYLYQTREVMRQHDLAVSMWLQDILAFRKLLGFAETEEFGLTRTAVDSLRRTPLWLLPQGDRRDPFTFEVEELLASRENHDLALDFVEAKLAMRRFRAAFRRDAAALRERVEAELATN